MHDGGLPGDASRWCCGPPCTYPTFLDELESDMTLYGRAEEAEAREATAQSLHTEADSAAQAENAR